MNTLSKYVVMLTMSTAMGAAAFAADTSDKPRADGRDGHHMGWEKMTPEKMQEYRAKRMNKLHDQLKLTAAQEPAWKTYVAATAPTGMKEPWGDRAAMEKMSAPERLEKHLAMSKEREARMASHLAALKTFYAALTPEQQQVLNMQTMHGGKHHGHHGHHGQHGMEQGNGKA